MKALTSLITRRSLVAAAAATPLLAAQRSFAQLAAPFEDADWKDAARNRTVPIRLRWPTGTAPAGGWPVIVYSHGLGGSRAGGTLWGEAWAQAGFVVLHLQHPGSDTGSLATVRAGGVTPSWFAQELIKRVADVRFAIDEIERLGKTASRWAQLDLKRIGVGGHSYGAHTTMGVAGQRYPFAGNLADGMPDPRVKAFIALSPNPPRRGADQSFGAITRPMLLITGSLDGDVLGDGSTPQGRQTVFGHLPKGNKAMLVLEGADHMSFGGGTGDARSSLRSSDREHHAQVARLSTDWWRLQLNGEAAARERLAKPQGLQPGDQWLWDA